MMHWREVGSSMSLINRLKVDSEGRTTGKTRLNVHNIASLPKNQFVACIENSNFAKPYFLSNRPPEWLAHQSLVLQSLICPVYFEFRHNKIP